jgi:DNA-binding XRE family transcriptional regulator
MIKNERQYRITKAQAAKFEATLKTFGPKSRKDQSTHPRLVKAQKDAIKSQLNSLNGELREYEGLQSGKVPAPDLGYIAVVPRDLIRARIASGLTQKDLAKRLGMAEQQIQLYEAKDYESVSLARIAEIAKAIQPSRSSTRKGMR